MKAKTIYALAIIVLVIVVWIIKQNISHSIKPIDQEAPLATNNFKNATYEIEGQQITLVDGYSKASIEFSPDSMTTVETRYFGNSVEGDFNHDGMTDTVLLLTQNPGGSGTFYYVALALGTKSGYSGANSIFLGDRIAPQTTEYRDGSIIVNYADRKPDEPFTAAPSVGVSRYFKVSNNLLVEMKK